MWCKRVSHALQEEVHPESPSFARTYGQATPEGRRPEGADSLGGGGPWRLPSWRRHGLLDVSIVNVALPSIERVLARVGHDRPVGHIGL